MKKLVSLFLLLIVLAVSSCSTVPRNETQSPIGIIPGEYQHDAIIIFLVDELTIQALTIEFTLIKF